VARTRGRVGALLEVGTGFHPELSGRDNVFLSGAVMGMTRTDIRRRYDEIVEFAGVTDFLDTPLKRYSSGMRLRLAFAVAAHLEPELMLVDEILAVGDVEFQRRCLTRMGQLSREGRTVVFISHDLGAVTRLCPRAVWMDHGRVVRDGESTDVVQEYYAAVIEHAGEVELDVEGDVGISRIALTDEQGDALQRPQRGDPLGVTVTVVVRRPVPSLDLAVYLLATDGSRILDESWSEQEGFPPLAAEPGEYAVRIVVPPLLRAGDYVLGVWLGTEHTDYHQSETLALSVVPRVDDRQAALTRPRVVQPLVRWSSRRLTSAP
jgi:ABC-2 type transport system ATP-binding protein/lipopolysaccharide transport system ATP-binding protein